MAFDYGSKEIETAGYKEKNSKVYSKTLFGQDILKNSVPIWTADKTKTPYVIFQDPNTGKKFGISRDKLSLGLLAMGAPGGGKTNFLNINFAALLTTMKEERFLLFLTLRAIILPSLETGFQTKRRL